MTNTTDSLTADPRTRAMMRIMLMLTGPKLLSRFDAIDRRALDQLAAQKLIRIGSLRGGSTHVQLTDAGARIRDLMLDAATDALIDWL